ncbi:pirin [Serinibacter arcticus]|uniref:Pirin n=1 Tax=Serinibacter arcticus TaxID=1655435 RepID=A0A2U1ZXR8_9MICO|nr:pirin family protein [Serinibacter arcticus]PWD51787.1 pirin [Serinibacter arcticus]
MTDLEARPAEQSCPADAANAPVLERYEARDVPLGGVRSAVVSRTLPHRALSTVGAWCFLDAFVPGETPMNVLPHPHIGLQTVTWPLSGQMLHRDSLGSEQLLRAGELNLMTSGDGVAHSEFMVDDVGARGLQLWVALPEEARRVPRAFEHVADLPVLERPGIRVTVFLGEHDGGASPATVHSPILGAQIELDAGADVEIPLRADFEHAVQLIDGAARVAGEDLGEGPLLYLGTGRTSLRLEALQAPTTGRHGATRLLLIGGEPLREDLLMWWNFVGRTHEEVVAARADWSDRERREERFGHVVGHGEELIPAPPLPNVRLTPRRRHR